MALGSAPIGGAALGAAGGLPTAVCSASASLGGLSCSSATSTPEVVNSGTTMARMTEASTTAALDATTLNSTLAGLTPSATATEIVAANENSTLGAALFASSSTVSISTALTHVLANQSETATAIVYDRTGAVLATLSGLSWSAAGTDTVVADLRTNLAALRTASSATEVAQGSASDTLAGATLLADAHPLGACYLTGTMAGVVNSMIAAAALAGRVGRKNLLNYSNYSWAGVTGDGTNTTVTPGQTDEYGGATAATLSDIGTSSPSIVLPNSTVCAIGGYYTVQVQVRKETSQTDAQGNARPAIINIQDGANLPGVSFNPLTGAIANFGSGVTASSVVDQGNGWWLITWTFVANRSSLPLGIAPAAMPNGSNTGSITIGECQLEEGQAATPIERVSAPTQGKPLSNAAFAGTTQVIDAAAVTKTFNAMLEQATALATDAASVSKNLTSMVTVAKGGPINRREVHLVRSLR